MRDIDQYNVRKKDGQVVNEAAGINPDGSRNVSLTGSNVKDYWNGSANITKTFSGNRTGLMIANDGSSDVTVTVGSLTFTVKSSEVLDERFDPFTQVTITTTSAYRAWARG